MVRKMPANRTATSLMGSKLNLLAARMAGRVKA